MVVCLFVDAIAAVVAQCKAGAKITDLCDTGDSFMNECVVFLLLCIHQMVLFWPYSILLGVLCMQSCCQRIQGERY